MNAPAATPSRRSYWSGLDVLVLEEIDALAAASRPGRRPPPPAAGADFASDEDFLVRNLRFLAGHADPASLVASLSAAFPPPPAEAEAEAAAERAGEEEGDDSAAADPPAGKADEAGEAEG